VAVDVAKLEAAIPPKTSIVLDATPLIAYFDGREALSPVANLLIDGWIQSGRNTGIVSVVSVAELLVGPRRAGRGEADVLDFLKHFPNLDCADVDFAIADAAATLRASTNLKMPDALIIATGKHLGAGAIATNDRAWKTLCPSLPIITLSEY
jgi:predicted nucleic acid-binding protein